jgi:plastocyanin
MVFQLITLKKRRFVMKRKRIIVMLTILVCILCLQGITIAAEEKADQLEITSTIVTVSTFDGIQPASITSKPGTTVVWLNRSRIPAEVLFLDKKVVLACGSPVNFIIGKNGAYESGKIISRGTASLCFTEKGKYEYVVKPSGTFYKVGEHEYRGAIVIE